VTEVDLDEALTAAERAAERARAEILPRFRSVAVETKADGSPVTEADRAAERAIREVLRDAVPGAALLGEEYGVEGAEGRGSAPESPYPPGRVWVVDPIDGTVAFSRGIPLFSTLIALVEDGTPILGLIDLPALDERLVATRGRGCFRDGKRVVASRQDRLERALISHGDPFCFDRAGQRAAYEHLTREVGFLRGYTDAFGHAQAISGGVDAMIDCDLSPWDLAASLALIGEAEGASVLRPQANGKWTIVLGSRALVPQLADLLRD